jgi:hypothetical protein
MIDHENAKKKSYEGLKKIENVRILSDEETHAVFPHRKLETWEVSTEIPGKDGKLEDIKLNLVFLPDFPLSFPKVFLGKDDFERIKYIPHVEASRLVCTFHNQAKPNPNTPSEVVAKIIQKAKRIIEDGVNGVNTSDFNDEFVAYWESEYSDKDSVLTNVLLLAEEPMGSNIKLIKLDEPINKISYIIHQDESIGIRFKTFLEDYGRKYIESHGYFLGDLMGKFNPPYDLTNKAVIQLVKGALPNSFDNYKKFLNNQKYPKLIIFSKQLNNEQRYFGWIHKKPKLNRNGFRAGSLKVFNVLTSFEGHEHVVRISPELFNPTRLIERSSGNQLTVRKPVIYSMAGLGSIGSNLVHYLKTDPRAEFRLIDTDKLKPENLGRHLLGFNHLNWNKTSGIQDFLKKNNPIREVTTRESSIYNVVVNEPEYINESSVLVVSIGEENIERWIASKLRENIIKVPILFIWAEPYLIGGHCIYITSNDNNYRNLFDEHGLFKFNVIHKDDYLSNNPNLSLREAGCQTNFTPFSADQILIFLGALYPHISQIILSGEQNAKCFTWVGSKSIQNDLNLCLSDYGEKLDDGSITQNNL